MSPAVDRVAMRQLGLITAEQLEAIGLTGRQVRWWVQRGVLVVVRFRVYRLAGAPISWEQAVLAAALCAGPDVVISHTTAAALWNLRHSDRHTAGIHVSGDRLVRMKGVTSHRTRVTPAERTFIGAMPITTPERTIIDLAGTLSVEQLGQSLDDAIRRQLVGLERLRRLVAQAAEPGCGRRLLAPVHKLLADRVQGYRPDDSEFETEMNRLWDLLGLPPARRQYRIVIDGHSYRLDRAIVEYKIGVEWDSYRHHTSASDRDYDSNRRARLVSHGWIVIPVTGNSRPELIAGAVRRAYLDRAGLAMG